MMKRLGVALAALAVIAMGGACGLENSETNEIGLIYSGGVVEDKEFIGILRPGATAKATGYGSTTYRYRIDQRSYIGAPEGKQRDTGPVQVVSEDDVRMRVEY